MMALRLILCKNGKMEDVGGVVDKDVEEVEASEDAQVDNDVEEAMEICNGEEEVVALVEVLGAMEVTEMGLVHEEQAGGPGFVAIGAAPMEMVVTQEEEDGGVKGAQEDFGDNLASFTDLEGFTNDSFT